MKKQLFSSFIAMGLSLILFAVIIFCKAGQLRVNAAGLSTDDITVNSEYAIPDGYDWCTYYVVVATNNTGCDISISADFSALDKDGQVLSKVNDYSEAVKNGQQFILYGQFKNSDIKRAVKYQYEFEFEKTDNCTYTSVDVDAMDAGGCIEVSATNYSEHDIQGVGIRTVFLRNGSPVAFDTVNIADVGYTFHGGSTNSQMVGYNAGQYDNYIMTYTSAGNGTLTDF
ncbi:hypothetical protein [Butyrivibrio sp. YAB3001]|uniref:hypothetical protein n=1 Tax=Butyrivibrio sp. YAB3001 TaxID=1520812 RepID=UPI0008F64400|nr:hypothetical protein [Butyrivibrio sp. YAB3001]SFC93091.1 hypothetical protein SAMN02910398_03560 [Butyrivibrio sp. YAB3001]